MLPAHTATRGGDRSEHSPHDHDRGPLNRPIRHRHAAVAASASTRRSAARRVHGLGDDDPQPVPEPTTASNFEYVDCPSPNIEGAEAFDFPPEVRCGYLTVPENRGEPEGKQIRIFVMRAPATSDDPKPDPIVMLAGGPGGGGSFEIAGKMAAGLNAEREVIFVDQRGTHFADPLLELPRAEQADQRCDQHPVPVGRGDRGRRRGHRVVREPGAATPASTPRHTTPPRTRPISPICASRWASTNGTSTASRTDRGSRWRTCAITPKASAASCSIRCRRRT